jgi:putative aminopeptidase FrvX
MDDLLRELISTPGVSGHEERVRALVERSLPAGVAVSSDAMGNLVATLGDGERAVMFVAHMDEIGFVVSEVRDDGFLKLKPLGGIDPRTVFGRLLRVVTESGEVSAVVSVKPPHLMTDRAREMKEVPDITEFLVDVGARSRSEAEALGVRALDTVVMDKQIASLNHRLICARALDDRAGCYILLRALERLVAAGVDLGGRVHFAFSVQEEIGLRGASLLARRFRLAHAFAVDSVSTADWPGVAPDLSPARVGAGTCLRVLDNASVIPVAFRRELQEIAAVENIPLQVVFSGGGTDARAFQTEGPHVMSLSFPVRYTHAAVEIADLDDIEQTIRFVCALAKRYGS